MPRSCSKKEERADDSGGGADYDKERKASVEIPDPKADNGKKKLP